MISPWVQTIHLSTRLRDIHKSNKKLGSHVAVPKKLELKHSTTHRNSSGYRGTWTSVSTGRLIFGSARINLRSFLKGKHLNLCPHLSLLSQILLKGHDVWVNLLRFFHSRVESDLGQKLGSYFISLTESARKRIIFTSKSFLNSYLHG